MDTRRAIPGLSVLPELVVTDYKQQPVYRGHAEQAVALLEAMPCLARLAVPGN